MPAISKSWVVVADSAVDPDSPLDTILMTGMRDDLIHLREWIGAGFTAGAVQDHNHDGVNSAQIEIGPNLLRNASFESDASGWTITNFSGGSNAISTSTRHHGAKSLSFTSTVLANGGGDAVSNEYMPCAGLRDVVFEVLRSASAAGVSSKTEVIWYDAAKSQISISTIYSDVATPTTVGRVGALITPPVAARFFRVRLTGGVPNVGSAIGTVFFDGVLAADRAADGELPLGIIKFGMTNVPQAATNYLGVLGGSGNSAQVNAQLMFDDAVTVSELRLHNNASLPASQTFTVTVQKNGADTALSAQLTSASQFASDLVNQVNFGTRDLISLKIVASATTGSTIDVKASVVLKRLGSNVGHPGLLLKSILIGAGATHFVTEWDSDGTEVNRQIALPEMVMRAPGFFNTSGDFDSRWPFLRFAGGGTVGSSSPRPRIGGTDMQGLPNGDLLVDAGSLFTHKVVENGGASPTAAHAPISFKGKGDGSHPKCLTLFSAAAQTQGTTVYLGGYSTLSGSATESDVQVPMPACTVRNLRATLDTTPAGGQSVVFTVRKNGADTTLSVTVDSIGRTAVSSGVAVSFSSNDLLSISSVSSATVGTRYAHAVLEVSR